jgi:ABC-type uncharacterized transport system involved in gliding motility auxiliary subunit
MDEASRGRLLTSSMLGVGVALAIVLFLIVNYFGWKYHTRLDWTRAQLYSLSEKTENILAGLDRDIEVVVFLSPVAEVYGPVRELLASYEGSSDRLSVRYVDAERNLLEAQSLVDRYELSQLDVVVFDSGEDRRVVNAADLADYDYSGMQFGQGPEMRGFKGEQVFTSTLVELMESRKPKILFTTGHGELKLDDFSARGLSAARDLLGQDNFQLEEWPSLGEVAVPAETDLVVVAGPTSTFLEPELEVLRGYLEGEGRLLLLLDPTLAPTGGLVRTGLEALMADYGVAIGENVVVDPANPLPFFSAETIFVNNYGSHLITRALDEARLPVIVSLARSVGSGDESQGLEVTELLFTSIEGWGETDLDELQGVNRQDSDDQGPVPLAVAVAATSAADEGVEDEQPEASPGEETPAVSAPATSREPGLRLVVVGDSDFAGNGQLQNVPNATLLANMLNWLVERETLVGVPPKEPEQVRLSLSRGELSRITWLVLVVLPGLAVALGVAVFLHRRR